MRRIAVTGATGFVGRHVAERLREAGFEVRALVRRDAPGLAAAGIALVPGTLDDEASLRTLVQGTDAVIHVAGVIHARDRAGFMAINAIGTARLADVAAGAGRSRLIHISSLAARAPSVSPYAESKAAGEREVLLRAERLGAIIVRPPAVWGPGDPATLPVMQGLARGWLVAPRGAAHRFSLLFVSDLADLVLTLLRTDLPTGLVLEPDDGRSGGYTWPDLAALAARQLERKVRVVGLGRGAFAAAAAVAERYAALTGRRPMVTATKVAELFHADWVADPGTMADLGGWHGKVDFATGLLPTLAWYRAMGWLGEAERMKVEHHE